MATPRLLSARLAAAVLFAICVSIGLLPAVGHADPDLTIEEVQARVDRLYEEAEVATERAHDARLEVNQTKQRLATVQDRLADQKDALAELDAAAADYAVAVYTTGGVDPTLQVLLSADPEDVLGRARSLDQVSRIQDAAFRQAEAARIALAQTQAEVDQELAHLEQVEQRLAAQEQAANDRLADARQLLADLEEEERQRLAALQARRAAAAAEASRDAVRSLQQSVPTSTGSGSGRAGTAVAYAMAQIGDAYVYGAAGPDAFDCSGLTMAAWAQAGVYLPHSAAAQYGVTSRVSTSSLQPGDLLFFYSGISHVGIYVGGGTFVHAANPGDGVLAESLAGYWSGVLVGAGRV